MLDAPTTTRAARFRGRPGPRVRTVLACGAVALVALGLGGCAAARNELGTASSGCYVDLALATRAVHHEGRLEGVRLVSVPTLSAHAPLLFDAAKVHGRRLGEVCLVAFGGSFRASRVEYPIGKATGRLAVVELGYPNRALLATLLVAHPPLPFGHYHL
ncbi:MAG TPA: hypothetical protein VMD28_03080 [Acidimicrobiales bacterium]|nr:hypothetical protein [Acidimicrobiales bacterium]